MVHLMNDQDATGDTRQPEKLVFQDSPDETTDAG